MIIGNFTCNEAQDTYTGELATLTVAARKVVFRPIEAKGDKAPLGWRSCRFSAIPERMNHEQIPYRCRPPAEAGHAR